MYLCIYISAAILAITHSSILDVYRIIKGEKVHPQSQGRQDRLPQEEYGHAEFALKDKWISFLRQSQRAGVSSNMPCSNTQSMSAGARAEFRVRAHALRRPPHLSIRMPPSAVYIRGLNRRRESKMLGIRGVRQGGYICQQEPWHVHSY